MNNELYDRILTRVEELRASTLTKDELKELKELVRILEEMDAAFAEWAERTGRWLSK